MRRHNFLILVVLGGCFIFLAAARAEEGPVTTQAKEGKAQESVAKCPQCADLVAQLKAKRDERKSLGDKIKSLRDSGKSKREARREELKTQNPKKYEELMAKQAQRKNNHEGKPAINKEEKLEQLKQRNPEMYQLVLRRQQLLQEMKGLRGQIKKCRDDCLGKK